MTVRIYSNGTGGVIGDELITETELYTTGIVYFVHHTGSNANAGQLRQKPFATLAYALTNVVADDVVVLLSGHTETISAKQTISTNGLRIIGEGSSSGNPTVTLTLNVSGDNALLISGTNVTLANVKIPAGSSASVGFSGVKVTGIRSMIRGCRFEVGATDVEAPIEWAANGCRLFNTTIVNVSTTTPPELALYMESPTDCEMEACTIDGGATGFGLLGVAGTSPVRFRAQQMRLLNGGSVVFVGTPTGYVGLSEKSGAPIVLGFSKRLPNGFRQTGDALLADVETYLSGTIYYTHYGTGADTNSGLDELAPLKTISAALALCGTNCDFVVLLPGHEEPLTAGAADITDNGVTIIGCGTTGGKPSCRLWRTTHTISVLLVTSNIGYVRNVWLDQTTATSNAGAMSSLTGPYVEMRGCLVTVGFRDQIGTRVDGTTVTLRESKWESGATATGASRPLYGLHFTTETSMSDIDVRGCIVSNAQYGFTGRALYDQHAVTRLYVINMTQSFGGDAFFHASTTGQVNPQTASGSSLVEW